MADRRPAYRSLMDMFMARSGFVEDSEGACLILSDLSDQGYLELVRFRGCCRCGCSRGDCSVTNSDTDLPSQPRPPYRKLPLNRPRNLN